MALLLQPTDRVNTQLKYFVKDISRLLGKKRIRILHIWMSRVFWGLLLYRFERGSFLCMGSSYKVIRVFFLPLLYPIQAYSNIEIHYQADIKGGLIILHPSVGAVVSGLSKIGENLTLTGGNIIGGKPGCTFGDIEIGNNCTLGANSTIIGPVRIADNVTIGASACVVNDCLESNSVLVGVPARKV